jgi:hypothetical protein
MIGASNIIENMQLIEESNQMNYILLVLVDFHDCFLSQMIWAYHWQTTTLCNYLMIAFACGLWVVTCSWFCFNAIVVLHKKLFELTLAFFHVLNVKDNKLRLRIMCQPGGMKQSLDGCCWLICGLKILNLPMVYC